MGERRYHQPSVEVVAQQSVRANAQLVGTSLADNAGIGGQIIRNGEPVAGVTVDLFVANGDGSRGWFLGSRRTGESGRYEFSTPGNCYIITMVAPDESLFTNGRPWHQPAVCVDGGQVVSNINGELQ